MKEYKTKIDLSKVTGDAPEQPKKIFSKIFPQGSAEKVFVTSKTVIDDLMKKARVKTLDQASTVITSVPSRGAESGAQSSVWSAPGWREIAKLYHQDEKDLDPALAKLTKEERDAIERIIMQEEWGLVGGKLKAMRALSGDGASVETVKVVDESYIESVVRDVLKKKQSLIPEVLRAVKNRLEKIIGEFAT